MRKLLIPWLSLRQWPLGVNIALSILLWAVGEGLIHINLNLKIFQIQLHTYLFLLIGHRKISFDTTAMIVKHD